MRFLRVGEGGQLQHSGMATAEHNRPVNLIGVRLHALTEGSRFDLERRMATPPATVAFHEQ